MEYSEFLGQLQHRLELDSQQAAVTAARASLVTLGERLDPGEARDLASQLPREIGRFLTESADVEGFTWDTFVDRVVEREGLDADDRGDAVYHARVVMALVAEATDAGEFVDVRAQLPEEYDELFVLLDEGATPE